jgi:hypothetical protein
LPRHELADRTGGFECRLVALSLNLVEAVLEDDRCTAEGAVSL